MKLADHPIGRSLSKGLLFDFVFSCNRQPEDKQAQCLFSSSVMLQKSSLFPSFYSTLFNMLAFILQAVAHDYKTATPKVRKEGTGILPAHFSLYMGKKSVTLPLMSHWKCVLGSSLAERDARKSSLGIYRFQDQPTGKKGKVAGQANKRLCCYQFKGPLSPLATLASLVHDTTT